MPMSTTPLQHPSLAATTRGQAQHNARISAIDVLRGLVMLIMLIDHVRETVYRKRLAAPS